MKIPKSKAVATSAFSPPERRFDILKLLPGG